MGSWKSYGINNLPSHGGVYVVLSSAGRPYYIGQSENVRTRFLSHRAYPKWPIGSESLLRIKVSMSPRRGENQMREVRLIRRLQPSYNRMGKL